MWHGPDERAHFTSAYIIAETDSLPKNRHYRLPLSIDKSISVSNFLSYDFDNKKRYVYDGRYAPFEKSVDDAVSLDEACELFYNLPAWDLEQVSIAWMPNESETKDESVSFDISILDSLLIEGENIPFLLYGRVFTGASFVTGKSVRKTTGFLFSDKHIVKVLNPLNSAPDASIRDSIATFKKSADEHLTLRVIPVNLKLRSYYPYTYSYPPLYYASIAGIIRLTGFFGGGIIAKIVFCRLFSVIWLILSLFFVYKSFRLVWPEKEQYALAGVALFALWPMNSFVFGLINPDVFLNLFSTIAFYFIIKILFSNNYTTSDWLFFALASAFAALSKVSGTLLIAIWWVLLIPVVISKENKLRWSFILPPLVMFLAPYLLWFKKHGFGRFYGRGVNLTLWQYLKARFDFSSFGVFRSFAGNFGSLRNPMPEFAYVLLSVFSMGLLLLLIYGLIWGFKEDRKLNFAYLLICTLLSILFFYVMEFINLSKLGIVLQGRYFLFLALPMSALIWSAAVEHTNKHIRRFCTAAGYLFVISVIFINGYALFDYMLQNFYS